LFSGEADLLNQSGKHAKVGVIRRRIVLVPWALGLILLLAPALSADDTIDALQQAEREARAKLADASGELVKARKAHASREISEAKLDQAVKAYTDAEHNANRAADARRSAEARNIITPKAASDARERFERAEDRARQAWRQSELMDELTPDEDKSLESKVGNTLRNFDFQVAHQDFKMALQREAELHDKEADRLEADASAESKAKATRAREVADIAAGRLDRLRAELSADPPLVLPKKAETTPETVPPGSAPPPGDFLPSPFDKVIAQREVTDPSAFGTGGQPVSADVTVSVENRLHTLICIPPGDDAANVATALGLANSQVVATTATGTIIMALGDPQTIEAKAKEKRINLCFVEINYCMIMTPLTAFRGHVHELHRGGLHDHDAPDPPWNWSMMPPEPVVSWGGR
jgi:hypothetical protein